MMCFSGYHKRVYAHMFRTVVETNAPICRYGGKFIVAGIRNALGEIIAAGRACGFFVCVGRFCLSGNRRFLVFR